MSPELKVQAWLPTHAPGPTYPVLNWHAGARSPGTHRGAWACGAGGRSRKAKSAIIAIRSGLDMRASLVARPGALKWRWGSTVALAGGSTLPRGAVGRVR